MSGKTVPLSVRITNDDAEFLASIHIDDATTLSDKMRAILKEFRMQKESSHNYEGYLRVMNDSLFPVLQQIKATEAKLQLHSELIEVLSEWLMEIVAFFVTQPKLENKVSLKKFEGDIAERVFRLLARVLRMSVIQKAPCYDDTVIRSSINPLMELFQVIQRNLEEEQDNE